MTLSHQTAGPRPSSSVNGQPPQGPTTPPSTSIPLIPSNPRRPLFLRKEIDVDYSKAFPFLLEINKVLQVQGSPWDSDKAIYHPVWLSQFDHTESKEANGPTGQFCLCAAAPSVLPPPFQCPLAGTDVRDRSFPDLNPSVLYYNIQWPQEVFGQFFANVFALHKTHQSEWHLFGINYTHLHIQILGGPSSLTVFLQTVI